VFNNQQLMQVPPHQDIKFTPLADKALLHLQLNWMLFYVPLVIVLAGFYYFNNELAGKLQLYVFIATPFLVGISLIYNVFNVRLQGIALRDHDIAFKKGVIWQQVTILPLSRVQHTEVHRGPLERRLGLASLKLYSAGGMSADLQISGLTHNDCKDIRQFVQSYGVTIEPLEEKQEANHD
jgi:membrane protein YdbS with pleckstrin-like domain